MGFPYDEAAWSVVDGAMFMGWGTAMPGVYPRAFERRSCTPCLARLALGRLRVV